MCAWRWLCWEPLIGCRGVFISNLCGFLGNNSLSPFRSTEQHLFLLSLESAELHGVVWGCFSRLLKEVATNLMIHICCPSLGRARKAFLLCWAWVFWLSRGWYRQSSRDRDFCTVSVEVARFLSQTPAFVGILI